MAKVKGRKKSKSSVHKNRKSKTRKSINPVNPMIVEYRNVPPLMAAEKMLLPPDSGDIIWRRLYQGIKVQQLYSDLYSPVIDLIQNNTTKSDPLCRIFCLSERWSAMEPLHSKAKDWLDKCISLVAVSEDNKKVYGTLIGRIINSDRMQEEIKQLKKLNLERELPEKEQAEMANKQADSDRNPKKPKKKSKKRNTRNNKVGSKNESKKTNNKETKKKNKKDHKKNKTPTDKKAKDNNTKHSRRNNEIKKLNQIEPPIDIIPVEVKQEVPVSVFDDDFEEYSDEHLLKFMKFRYGMFSLIDWFLRAPCYYKIYVWTVDREHQNQGIGTVLLDAAESMCLELQVPVIISIFTSYSSQHIAENFAYTNIAFSGYDKWSDIKIENERTACLMYKFLNVPVIDSYLPQDNDIDKKILDAELKPKNDENLDKKHSKKKKTTAKKKRTKN